MPGRTRFFNSEFPSFPKIRRGGVHMKDRFMTRQCPPMPGSSTPDVPCAEPLIPESEPVQVTPINPMPSFQWYGPAALPRQLPLTAYALDGKVPAILLDGYSLQGFQVLISIGCGTQVSSLLSSQSGRVRRLAIEIPVTRAQARRGGTVTISVPARARCPSCFGYGRVGIYACSGCAGEGAITGEMPVAISFPPDIPDNYEVIIPFRAIRD